MKINPETAGFDPARLERVDEHLRTKYVDPGKIAGCQVAVSRHGQLAHFSSIGQMDRERARPVQDDTIWRLYSMTKPITAMAAMILIDQGKLTLDGALDALVALHARFWDAIPPAYLDPARAGPSVTQSAQAWPPALIARHATAVHAAAAAFRATQLTTLSSDERALLDDSLATWERQLTARVADSRAITLIHADFHFYGNVLFARDDPRPRVIDWSELKPGLGPHDLAYCLVGAPSDDRPTRDLALLCRYSERLVAAGVAGYSSELSRWDHQFSLVTYLLQAVLQQSALWFSRSATTRLGPR